MSFAAYITIIITASGSLRLKTAKDDDGREFNVQSAAAWSFALLSTFGLPWGGIPLSCYLGVGSWSWCVFSAISLCIIKNDGREHCIFRRFVVVSNITVIMVAIYAFMIENGIPGDIPGIEGVGVINSLEGLPRGKLMLVQACFIISAIASFLPIHSNPDRASAMLSFSYASFLAIAFLPPAHIFIEWLRPDIAILCDAAAFFLCGWFMHNFIINPFSKAALFWRSSYITISSAALTATGIYFLFNAV